MQLELFIDAKIANLCPVGAKLSENENFDEDVLVHGYISSWEWIKEVYALKRPPTKSVEVLSANKNMTPLSVITRLARNYRALVNDFYEMFVPAGGLCEADIRYLALTEIQSAYRWLNYLKRRLLASMKNHSRKTLTYKSD